MSTSAPRKSTTTHRLPVTLIVAGAAVALTAVSIAVAQQDAGPAPMINAGSATATTTTTTNPQIAPATPQISFAKPTLTAPRYGKG